MRPIGGRSIGGKCPCCILSTARPEAVWPNSGRPCAGTIRRLGRTIATIGGVPPHPVVPCCPVVMVCKVRLGGSPWRAVASGMSGRDVSASERRPLRAQAHEAGKVDHRGRSCEHSLIDPESAAQASDDRLI